MCHYINFVFIWNFIVAIYTINSKFHQSNGSYLYFSKYLFIIENIHDIS